MTEKSYNHLLAFAEMMANHTSGNLHGFYPAEIMAARKAVKLAGGRLDEVGRYLAGSDEPMSHQDYSKRKDERKVECVLSALRSGLVRFISDDIYNSDSKRVCTHGELVGWIRQRLKKQGVKLIQKGSGRDLSWEIYSTQPTP